MTDYFELMNLTRRPWVDSETVRSVFRRLSTELHPDRFHNDPAADHKELTTRYAELNTAQQTLSDPKLRIRHLLELETGQRPGPVDQMSRTLVDLFFEVGAVCKESDRFLKESADHGSSPMLKVQRFQQGMKQTERIQILLQKVQQWQASLDEELRRMNSAWETAPEPGRAERPNALPLRRLEEIYRQLSYLGRWHQQLNQRIAELALL